MEINLPNGLLLQSLLQECFFPQRTHRILKRGTLRLSVQSSPFRGIQGPEFHVR